MSGLYYGLLLGVLLLAGAFNLTLLLTNRRNLAHLYFLLIPWTAAAWCLCEFFLFAPDARDSHSLLPDEAVLDQARRSAATALLPPLFFGFFYAMFPGLNQRLALRSDPDEDYARTLRRDRALALVRIALIGLGRGLAPAAAAVGLALWAFRPETAALATLIGAGPALLAASAYLALAALYRQQGALTTLIGYALLLAFWLPDLVRFAEVAASDAPARGLPGFALFALTMMIVIGANRYRMHRELTLSQRTLRENLRKLKANERLRNGFLAAAARESMAPLRRMLEQLADLVDDPRLRLSAGQLRALAPVLNLARRLLRRNERVARYFSDAVGERAELQRRDLAEYLELQKRLLEARAGALQLELRAGTAPLFARFDAGLLELLLAELHDPAESGAEARRSEIVASAAPEGGALLEIRLDAGEGDSDALTGQAGLTLSLARRIAELHGSELELDRGPGFVCRLRLPGDEPAASTDEAWQESLEHIRLLVELGAREQAEREAGELIAARPDLRRTAERILSEIPPT